MRRLTVLTLGISLAAFGAGCGDKKGDEGGESGGSGGGSSCSEKNAIEVSFGGDEGIDVQDWKLEKTEAFFSGMVYNGKAVAKHGYVAFGNYPVTLGSYMADVPKEQGKALVLVSFKTENSPVEKVDDQKPTYNELSLKKGDFSPTWMGKEPGFQISVFVGPKGSGPSISGDGAKGKATLTAAGPDRLCGSIDFTSKKGTTVKGTFNAKIAKDMWAKM